MAKNGHFGGYYPKNGVFGRFGPFSGPPERGFYINPSRRGPVPAGEVLGRQRRTGAPPGGGDPPAWMGRSAAARRAGLPGPFM